MKTVIIRRPFEDVSKTGLGRYADSVGACVDSPEYVEADLMLKHGLLHFLTKGLIRPFFRMLDESSDETVFHATDELCAFAFPFLKGRKVMTVHHVIKPGESGKVFHHIWHSIVATGLRHADAVVCISDRTAKDVVDIGADPERVTVVTNRIDPVFVPDGSEREDLICCVAELIPRKNVDLVIRSFGIMCSESDGSGYRLVVCGKGSEKDRLVSLIEDLDLSDRVEFVQDLTEREIVNLYCRSRLALTGSSHEGYGVTILEAQACGTPTLHIEGSDIPDLVTRASIPCRDESDMAHIAMRLMSDDDAWKGASEAAKRYADSVSDGFCERYRKALYG